MINCTGIGALSIGDSEDYNVYLTRGEILIVRAPWIKRGYMYYSRFPEDSLRLKVLVGFVWYVYWYPSLARYALLNMQLQTELDNLVPPHSFEAAILFSGLIAASVQGFFSFRIYALKKPYIAVLCRMLSALRLLELTFVSITAVGVTLLERYEKERGWLFMAGWCIRAATDVTITATLVVILYSQRSNVRGRTAALVDKIIAWAPETGLVTSALGMVMLICVCLSSP
ncbi:hypothetical protein C8F04DRAFT_1266412 [Mycena alexandri]|uniref:DUF6534 domain-containing protein n=1 Tax=Mycena alexandri TaxID=1745969 RepID=A0AAD6SIX3_9AGAR|nr:hypothetical protein C8F04DRAFT_1266412 [Mycena alexandri]